MPVGSQRLIEGRPCFWCGRAPLPNAQTRDHLIPVWAFLLLPELNPGPHNVRSACEGCNHRKGGMPPAIFYVVRARPTKDWKAQQAHWQRIRDMVTDRPDQALLDYIFAHMAAPYPGKPLANRVTGPERSLAHEWRLGWFGLDAPPEAGRRPDPRWDKLRELIR